MVASSTNITYLPVHSVLVTIIKRTNMTLSNLVRRAQAAKIQAATQSAIVHTATLTAVTTKMNNQAKASLVANQLVRVGLPLDQALVVATTFFSLEEELMACDPEWEDLMGDGLYDATGTVMADKEVVKVVEELTIDWKTSLVAIDLIDDECKAGKFLIQLNEEREKSFAHPASEGITAKNRKKAVLSDGTKLSPLRRKVLAYSQKVERTIDEEILDLAMAVYENWGVCDDRYVLEGAMNQVLNGNVPSVNEFFFDDRKRFYMGNPHGGNVQASDLARSLLSPYGLTLDYDSKLALLVLRQEAADMINGCTVDEAMEAMSRYTELEFMRLALTKGSNVSKKVKKPWSFVKISKLITALEAGDKPYLNITVGLDAKCSGPQLGALMVGCSKLAASCGFSETLVDDAYEVCFKMLENAGFVGLDRALMKTPFMGIFYGQGYLTFSIEANYALAGKEPKKNEHEHDLLSVMYSIGSDLEANAKKFHKIVELSFGAKLSGLRRAVLDMHSHWENGEDGHGRVNVPHMDGLTSYYLPDGQKVTADTYFVKDVMGELKGAKEYCPDFIVELGTTRYKFEGVKVKTDTPDVGRCGRTGFVNFIQAMDGLLAALIISKLEDLGATHADPVHDCFRVSVQDMVDGKLHKAIKFAYNSLFTYKQDYKTKELVLGTDAVKLYAEGANRAALPEYKMGEKQLAKRFSQFAYKPSTDKVERKLRLDMNKLVGELRNDITNEGSTYFFSK